MLLAELTVNHTRRHMATRRVMVADAYLPTSGRASGVLLATSIVAEFYPLLAEEQQAALPAFIAEARDGLEVPSIALRYRLQHDAHGLDHSRHRLLEIASDEDLDDGVTRRVLELDVHAAPDPQIIGLIMAVSAMGMTTRTVLLDAILGAIEHPRSRKYRRPPDHVGRLIVDAPRRERPPSPGRRATDTDGDGNDADGRFLRWANVPSEQRWAMTVLGMDRGVELARTEVQRQFRSLLRAAHPDQGGSDDDAAARIAELSEARDVLLAVVNRIEPARTE
jgi:hypothetical protein